MNIQQNVLRIQHRIEAASGGPLAHLKRREVEVQIAFS